MGLGARSKHLKIYFILFLCSFALGQVFSGHSLAQSTFPAHDIEIDGPANCRDKIKGKILKSIPNGTSVKALNRIETNGIWYQVSYEGTTCWTSFKNVKDTLDYPSAELIEALDKQPTAKNTKLNEVKLPNDQNAANFLLDNDPCFLVKFPSDASLADEAKRRCEKLNASDKKRR